MGDKGRDGALRRPRPKRAQRFPAALPPGIPQCGTARCPYRQDSGGFTAGDGAARRPYLVQTAQALSLPGSDGAAHRPYRDWNADVERQIEDS